MGHLNLSKADSSIEWRWPVRVATSLFLAFHILAVVAEPMQMFARSNLRTASDIRWLRGLVAAYVEMFYLDHGYFFFAPNPGPNHLVESRLGSERAGRADEVSSANASDSSPLPLSSFRFPDKRVHWPRLYYHRHFMLSEFYHNTHAWTDQPIEAKEDPKIDLEWRSDLAKYRRLQASMVRHIQSLHPNSTVELKRIEHQLPNEYRILIEQWRLDDPRLYETLPESLAERDKNLEETKEVPSPAPFPHFEAPGPWRIPTQNDSVEPLNMPSPVVPIPDKVQQP